MRDSQMESIMGKKAYDTLRKLEDMKTIIKNNSLQSNTPNSSQSSERDKSAEDKTSEEHLDLVQKAEQGDVGAQLCLGYFKQELQDLKQGLQDLKQAFQAIRDIDGGKKAVEQESGEAQYKRGCCYYFGTGIEQDFKQAFHWIHEASMKGNPEAWYWIGKVAKHGDAVASSQFVACYKSWEEVQKKKPGIS